MAMIRQNDVDGYWIETNREPHNPEDYRLINNRERVSKCYKCEHSKIIYNEYVAKYGGYTDKFRSIICEAGRVPICRDGFIQEEEFSL